MVVSIFIRKILNLASNYFNIVILKDLRRWEGSWWITGSEKQKLGNSEIISVLAQVPTSSIWASVTRGDVYSARLSKKKLNFDHFQIFLGLGGTEPQNTFDSPSHIFT